MSGLAKLTRPGDRQPVWISPSQVCSVQASTPGIGPPDAKTTIVLAQGQQFVVEASDVAAKAIADNM